MPPSGGNEEAKQPIPEKENRLSEEVLGRVIHKLNNHLTAVLGYSQILLFKLTNPGKREDAEKILREARRVSDILKDLSEYSKKREPKKEMVDISELVMKTVEVRTHELGFRNIEISMEVTPTIPLTQADSRQIHTALLKLIENAQQAISESRKGGKIIIEVKARGEDIEITVTDDGPGIAEENVSMIFTPFFTTEKYRTGLGLSICNEIAKAHGGKVEVKTERGEGASFIITLPIIKGSVEKD